MPVCPKCRSEFERGIEWCAACDAPLLDVVASPRPSFDVDNSEPGYHRPPHPGEAGVPSGPRHADPAIDERGPVGEERLILLLEEPLPEMAEMICEFLENCGIRSVVHSESIGLLYRLPAPGAPISRSRVYVLESDFQEARELVAHFFERT